MKKTLKYGSLALFFTFIGTAIWFFNSQQSLLWVIGKVNNFGDITVDTSAVRGTLAGPIEITGIVVRSTQADIRFESLVFDWNLFRILSFELDFKSLYAEQVELNLKTQTATASNTSEQIKLNLPIDVVLKEVLIKNIRVMQDNNEVAVVDTLQGEVILQDNDLRIRSFDLSSVFGKLSAYGSVKVNENIKIKLASQWNFLHKNTEIKGKGNFMGNIEELIVDQSLSGAIEMHLYARIKDLFKIPTWDVKVVLSTLDATLFLPEYNFKIHDSQLNSQGNSDNFNVLSQLNYKDIDGIQLQSDLNIDYRDEKWVIHKVDIFNKINNSILSVGGEVRLSDKWFGKLAEGNLTGNWKLLGWPLTGPSLTESESGKFSVKGNLDAYEFGINGYVSHDGVNYGNWHLRGSGDSGVTNITFDNSEIFSGKLEGNGQISWQHGFLWDFKIDAAKLNPKSMFPQWNGNLNVAAKIHGTLSENKLNSHIELARLDGLLRDIPLQASGKFEIENNAVAITDFNINSGSAKVNINGLIGEKSDLEWNVNVKKLNDFSPDLFGSVKIKGSFAGGRSDPIIKATVSAKKLTYKTVSAQKLYSDINVMPNDKLESKVAIKLYAVKFASEEFEQINLQGRGDEKNIVLDLNATGKGKDFVINTIATKQDKQWVGKIKKANYKHSKYGEGILQKPIEYLFEDEFVTFSRGCWKIGKGNVCGDFSWSGTNGMKGNLKTSNFQPKDLGFVIPESLQMEGKLSTDVSFSYSTIGQLTGNAEMNLTAGNVVYAKNSDNEMSFDYNSANVQFNAKNSAIAGSIKIDSNTFGKINGFIDIPLWNVKKSMLEQEISGQINIDSDKIEFLEYYVSDINTVKGKIGAIISINGQLASPILTANVNLEDGSFEVPRLGVQVEDVKLLSSKSANKEIKIEGSAKSGKGSLLIDGTVEFENNKLHALTLGFRGKNIQVANRSDLVLDISPELQCNIVGNRIDVVGDVIISNTKIQPPDVSDTIVESNDVVFLGKKEEEVVNEKWQVHTGIKFIFGEKVNFYGFGLSGGITGQIVVLDEPKQLTSSYGELNIVDGTYEAYDEKLKIVKGRLIFTGGPVNNPGVEVNAERTIAGSNIVVGVNIRGTLIEPEMTLYSTPSLDQTDILAYLILGVPSIDASNDKAKMNLLILAASTLKITGGESLSRRLANKFGLENLSFDIQDSKDENNIGGKQISVVLGKYLTPRLYINYSVGSNFTTSNPLSNTVRMQYKLSKKWMLQSEVSDGGSGADIIFSLEK